MLVKLAESPFYATGGGQVADAGVIECEDGDCRARVGDVLRVGDDQAVVVEVEQRRRSRPGERVVARVDRAARHATEANHTATHLLHAALRERLGTHVRQAGSYVGPDKLRFDFTHGARLSSRGAARGRGPRQRVDPRQRAGARDDDDARRGARARARWRCSARSTATSCGWCEIGDGSFSRELCGGTHVRSTAEIGVFKLTSETSSAANVRRIEALTGPGGRRAAARHDALLREAARALRTRPRGARRGRRPAGEGQGGGEGGAPDGATSTSTRSRGGAADVDGAQGRAHEAVDGRPTRRRCSTSPTA